MSDGIPDDRWALAEVIFVAIAEEARPWSKPVVPPVRKGYTHYPVAAMDLALAAANAVLSRFEVKPLEQKP